jgi:hypothetical protein
LEILRSSGIHRAIPEFAQGREGLQVKEMGFGRPFVATAAPHSATGNLLFPRHSLFLCIRANVANLPEPRWRR